MPRPALRICPLCEATCGLTLTVEGSRVTGPYGDGFGAREDGIGLERLLAHPHGIDRRHLRSDNSWMRNMPELLDGTLLDPLSGTAVLNGFPVELTAVVP
ncbi:hypothetical protein ACQB60_17930 [Actinomycetota bacterium Odt1-20B]